MPSLQKLIPLAGPKHSTQRCCLCCNRRLKLGVWAGNTHDCPPLTLQHRLAASMPPALPKPPQFSLHPLSTSLCTPEVSLHVSATMGRDVQIVLPVKDMGSGVGPL